MTKDKSQATFKTLRDNFEPNNDNTDETIDQEMQRSWRLFLAAGYDATQVAEMMLPEDVLKYYDKLVFYGADIIPRDPVRRRPRNTLRNTETS